MNFREYVQAIDQYPDESLDLVMVDGRSRVACIHHSVTKVKRGGFLILDDAARDRYQEAVSLMANPGWLKREFCGPVPSDFGFGVCIIWQRI